MCSSSRCFRVSLQKQETLADKLVLFNWHGYPRWPGIVVPPLPKSEILSGQGFFYKPDKQNGLCRGVMLMVMKGSALFRSCTVWRGGLCKSWR